MKGPYYQSKKVTTHPAYSALTARYEQGIHAATALTQIFKRGEPDPSNMKGAKITQPKGVSRMATKSFNPQPAQNHKAAQAKPGCPTGKCPGANRPRPSTSQPRPQTGGSRKSFI